MISPAAKAWSRIKHMLKSQCHTDGMLFNTSKISHYISLTNTER